MPTATLTVRELKNKDTGLDISIPTYKETPTLLGSTVEFNVVVVSRLSYFKSPKHKENDVVQFMVPRKYPDFEHLYNQVSEQFSGTILPPLPKKVLRLTEATIKDRKARLENFLKFLASTPKPATSSKLLVFLGVNPIKAGQYRKGDVGDAEQKTESEAKDEKLSEGDEEGVTTTAEENLFGETQDVDETDMFGGGEEQDLFPPDSSLSDGGAEARLFEEQELGGAIQEGEEDFLGFVPDARSSEKPVSIATHSTEEEDNSDLLKIEDDLDKLLVLEVEKDVPSEEQNKSGQETTTDSSSLPTKPLLKPKPKIPQKPQILQKPQLKEKPKIPGKKPAVPRKPSQEKPREVEDKSNKPSEEIPAKGDNLSTVLDNDDILKYIQDNAGADDDLDLFS